MTGFTFLGYYAIIYLGLYGGILGIISGLILGLGQWLVIQHILPAEKGSLGWILATMGGLTLGWGIGAIVAFAATYIIDLPPAEGWSFYARPIGGPPMAIDLVIRTAVVATSVGAVLGIAQWFILASNEVYWARRWLGVAALAWALGGIVFAVVYVATGGPLMDPLSELADPRPAWEDYYPAKEQSLTAGWVAGGVVIGVITGFALRRFLHLAQPSTTQGSAPPEIT
jgi:hypothetical protein